MYFERQTKTCFWSDMQMAPEIIRRYKPFKVSEFSEFEINKFEMFY